MLKTIEVFLDDVVYKFGNKALFLAIGTFDGVHLGHRKLISTVVEQAKNNNGTAAAYTFFPHPTAITHPEGQKPMICSKEKKYETLSQYDLSAIIEQKFDKQFSMISPKDFIKFLKTKFPTLQGICVGENFKFGHNRVGGTDDLSEYSKEFGITAIIIKSMKLNGEKVSSSRIRELISEGNLALAGEMLGQPYTKSLPQTQISL